MRLRFWLAVMDVVDAAERAAYRLGVCKAARDRLRDLYLWTVARASDATDWGETPSKETHEQA